MKTRKVTFSRLTAGHYVNYETGVEIQRDTVGNWAVFSVKREGLEFRDAHSTYAGALHWAKTYLVPLVRSEIAEAYELAVTDDVAVNDKITGDQPVYKLINFFYSATRRASAGTPAARAYWSKKMTEYLREARKP